MVSSPAERNEAQAKLWSMIKKIKVAMMTSWDGEAMHSRPMHGYQEEFEGKLYFFTRQDSGKTDEIGHYDRLNLAYVDIDDNLFVSIAGRGQAGSECTQLIARAPGARRRISTRPCLSWVYLKHTAR
jgi:general stress protein 26